MLLPFKIEKLLVARRRIILSNPFVLHRFGLADRLAPANIP